MVHVAKCPLGKNMRGRPSTEFYHRGKPQIYCLGRIDMMTEEPLEECEKCMDFVRGEQCAEDFEKHWKEVQNERDQTR